MVTGCTGFIASELIKHLCELDGYSVVGASRRPVNNAKFQVAVVGDINKLTNWSPFLLDVDVVIHLAGLAHVMKKSACCNLDIFHRTNVEGTLNLARFAVTAGVRRFIYISSIGVNGFQTEDMKPFVETDPDNPYDAYTFSKWKAEQGLREISTETSLEIVIIRPPLVYGFNAPGNFGALLGALRLGLPVPFGLLKNKRSYVSLNNLIYFITTCINHPNAANQTFLVSDGHDLSTPELIEFIANALGVRCRLIRLPEFIIKMLARIIGKDKAAQRLCGSLQVDISKARQTLGWTPPFSIEDSLKYFSVHK